MHYYVSLGQASISKNQFGFMPSKLQEKHLPTKTTHGELWKKCKKLWFLSTSKKAMIQVPKKN